MRTRLAAHDVPMPEFEICNTADEFTHALERFDYNCIAKPADSAASRGVRLITPDDRFTSAGELFELFRSFSRKGTVMVEERITGCEVSVEGMTVDGETTILTITDKLTTEPPLSLWSLGIPSHRDYRLRRRRLFARWRRRRSRQSAS